MIGTIQFPEGPREVEGYVERYDVLRDARMIIPHPELSREIWVPRPVDGFHFRLQPGDTWTAEPKT